MLEEELGSQDEISLGPKKENDQEATVFWMRRKYDPEVIKS